MFDFSFVLLLKLLVLNIVLPLLLGILFIWIVFGKKFKGFLLYLLGWSLGFGIHAFGLLNMQFFGVGVDPGVYIMLFGIMLVIYIAKLLITKESVKEYSESLKIYFNSFVSDLVRAYKKCTSFQKVMTIISSFLVVWFIGLTFIFTISFPTYADDTFKNWNSPVVNILEDGGVIMFGEEDEILGRERLGYPLHSSIYKANIFEFAGSEYNDIYSNIWNWLVFLAMLLYIFYISFYNTKNIFKSVVPLAVIISLPLVFFHASEGYLELSSVFYAILSVWGFYEFLRSRDYDYLSIGLLFGFIVANLKNDGFVVYFPAIVLTLFACLLLDGTLQKSLKQFFTRKHSLLTTTFGIIFLYLPFTLVKTHHGLGFNQAAGESTGVGLSSTVHWEVLDLFKPIFFFADNYNIVLLFVALILFIVIKYWKRIDNAIKFIILVPFVLFFLFFLVFLLTENYKFALNQTTINRVFTMCFILLFAFGGIIWNRLSAR